MTVILTLKQTYWLKYSALSTAGSDFIVVSSRGLIRYAQHHEYRVWKVIYKHSRNEYIQKFRQIWLADSAMFTNLCCLCPVLLVKK